MLIDQRQALQNFVAHGAFEALQARHDVCFAAAPADAEPMGLDARDFVDPARCRLVEIDEARAAAWKRLAFLAQIRPSFSPYRRRLRRMRLRPLPRGWAMVARLLALPGPRWIYAGLLLRRLLGSSHSGLERLLEEPRPDMVLLPSALNGPLLNDALLACRRRSIPTVLLMNSWDNPSTKNATAVPPDWLLVWGEQTRGHAIDYMGIPPGRVVALGAPQLEFLSRAELAPARRDFRAAHGIAGDTAVILYAASTIRTGDFEALRALDDAIADGTLPPCRIIYRAYPGMAGPELERICAQPWRAVLVQRDALPAGEAVGAALVRAKEQAKLRALAGADAVISPLSTILVEAAMLGRPVMCYFPQSDAVPKFRRANAPLVHFDDLLALPEVVVAQSSERLIPAARDLLARIGAPGLAQRLQARSRHFVVQEAAPYASRLADFVETVLSPAAAPPRGQRVQPVPVLAAAR